MAATTNRLASEPSLYLRQHGHNPVDWYPWGPEALDKSRTEDKPILLSIGYSACHWCHVMERECFEDERIAAAMNADFVCIKVDREERPDLDSIYMKTVQLLTGRGGWPMTVFLLPDLRPFYAGTYFPPEDRSGLPGLPRVLAAVAKAYREERDKLVANGVRLVELLREESESFRGTGASLTRDAFADAGSALTRGMDGDFGGFGHAPKFPAAASLSFLLGLERLDSDATRRERLRTTLDRMADGGIYDHVGGGFHRYSVDRMWLVPHFEKMLYDQAQLADTYAEGWLVFNEPRYAETASGILEYVAREMTGEHEAFFATQDADSEGEEGKFYLWSPEEVRSVLGERDADVICRLFDVTEEGNFESRNILHRTMTLDEACRSMALSREEVRDTIRRSLCAMYERRAGRVPPAIDTKILTDWNGLMIGAMASAGRKLGRDDLVRRAASAADFIRATMLRTGELLHVYGGGEARVPGLLDDYAFLGRGSLELFLALGRKEDWETALTCADALLSSFEDKGGAGFFAAKENVPDLIVRPRDSHDGAVPAGCSVATELLLRLHHLTGSSEYRRAGQVALDAMLGPALKNPYGASHLLTVAHRSWLGYATVVIASSRGDESRAVLLERAALATHSPETSVVRLDPPMPSWLPAALRDKQSAGGRSLAYLCRGEACLSPTVDADTLVAMIRAAG